MASIVNKGIQFLQENYKGVKELVFAEHVTVDNIHFNVLRLMVREGKGDFSLT